MRTRILWLVSAVVLGGALLAAILFAATKQQASEAMPVSIAHAGGQIHGRYYTNSLNALDFNYQRGFRYFELDFEWTSDDKLVLVHDWQNNWPHYGGREGAIPTNAEFMAVSMTHGLQQLDLPGLVAWLQQHPDARIVTDIKSGNLQALALISKLPLAHRFIPQAYQFAEYEAIEQLGFARIILTVYKLHAGQKTITHFVQRHRPWALTVPAYQIERGAYAELLHDGSVPIYVHTVNKPAQWKPLAALGVTGIYTDSLLISPAQPASPAGASAP